MGNEMKYMEENHAPHLVFIHSLNKNSGTCICLQWWELLSLQIILQLCDCRPWLYLILLTDYDMWCIWLSVKEVYPKQWENQNWTLLSKVFIAYYFNLSQLLFDSCRQTCPSRIFLLKFQVSKNCPLIPSKFTAAQGVLDIQLQGNETDC